MNSYYEQDGVTIYCGDCREILPQLSIDAVIADPPYGMNCNTRRDRFSGSRYRAGRGRAWGEAIIGDERRFNPSHLLDYPKVILWGSNHYAASLPVGTTLVWIKRYDHLFNSFLSDAEVAWMKGGCGVYCFRETNSAQPLREHPCEKPNSLLKWCIKRLGKGVSVICDPYMGSGTTLRAAKDMGLKAIGIEIDERYCEIAVKRLGQTVFNFEEGKLPRFESEREDEGDADNTSGDTA